MNDWVLPPRDRGAIERLDLDSLIGLTVPQARALVKESGGTVRAVVEGGGLTLNHVRDRVTVVVDDADRVVRVLGRG